MAQWSLTGAKYPITPSLEGPAGGGGPLQEAQCPVQCTLCFLNRVFITTEVSETPKVGFLKMINGVGQPFRIFQKKKMQISNCVCVLLIT